MTTQPLILIVDDDQPHRSMLRTVLRGWGYGVEEADDGTTAVALVRERAFDAVLTDVRMAHMDGITTLSQIRAWNPAIPVLIMTAWSSVESAVDALRLGAYDYLTKPLDFDVLRLSLERALDHTRLATENQELRRVSPIRSRPSSAAAGPSVSWWKWWRPWPPPKPRCLSPASRARARNWWRAPSRAPVCVRTSLL